MCVYHFTHNSFNLMNPSKFSCVSGFVHPVPYMYRSISSCREKSVWSRWMPSVSSNHSSGTTAFSFIWHIMTSVWKNRLRGLCLCTPIPCVIDLYCSIKPFKTKIFRLLGCTYIVNIIKERISTYRTQKDSCQEQKPKTHSEIHSSLRCVGHLVEFDKTDSVNLSDQTEPCDQMKKVLL